METSLQNLPFSKTTEGTEEKLSAKKGEEQDLRGANFGKIWWFIQGGGTSQL